MGLTYEQAKSLGLEAYWPDKASKVALPAAAPPPSQYVSDGMNKLERGFWGRLQDAQRQGIFLEVRREPIKLRLAGKTFYTPDFMSIGFSITRVRLWEVKGFMRDDAAVKLKVAAAQYPFFAWTLVQKDRGRWRCIDVTNRGFASKEWCPDWLE